jgi:hypothetical protein
LDRHASLSLNPQPRSQSWLGGTWSSRDFGGPTLEQQLGIETKLSPRRYDDIICSTDFKHCSQQIEDGRVGVSRAR